MSFAKEMSDFLGAYKTVTKTLDDSEYTRALTGFTQARTRALTADQDAVDAAVARTERRINTTNPTAAVGGTPAPAAAGPPPNLDARVVDQYLGHMVAHESSGNPNARASTSSATGLAQFTDGTWREMMERHPQLQLTADGRTDPQQAMRAARQFTYDNAGVLARANLPATPGNLYMTHFLGSSGGPSFLRRMQENPDAPATQFVDPDAASANRRVFFNSDGTPRTARQVYDLQTSRFRNIRVGDDTMPAAPTQSVAVERAPLAAPTRSQTVAAPSQAATSPYDEQGQLRPEHGGLSGPAREQAMRSGVAPQQFVEGGLVQESPDGNQPVERPAALPTTPAPVLSPATMPDGRPGDTAASMAQAPVPMARPSEQEIEQRQVADAMRQRPERAADKAPEPVATPEAPRAQAIPAAADQPASRPAQPAAQPAQNTGIAGILDGALRYIAGRLPPPRGLPAGAVAYALGRNADTPTPSQYQTVGDAVDPSGELSAGQRAIRVMQARHDLALQKGDLDAANRFAAGIIQYSQRLTARIASIGIVAGQNGNVGGMVAATAAAVNAIPAGAQITPGQPTRDGQIPVTIREPNGRTRNITLSPRQVMETALGLQNGALYWETLQRAAAQHQSAQGSGGMDPDAFERHMRGEPAVTPGSNAPAAAPTTPAAPAPAEAEPAPAARPNVAAAPPAGSPPASTAPAPDTPPVPAPASPIPSSPAAPAAPAPAAPEAPPPTAPPTAPPAPGAPTAVARSSALPTEMTRRREAAEARPSREPVTPRPVRPTLVEIKQEMNAAQRAAVNQRNQAAIKDYEDKLKVHNEELAAIRAQDAQQRGAAYIEDRADTRDARRTERDALARREQQERDARMEAAKHRYQQQQTILTARRTEDGRRADAARLHRPTAENIRSVLPDIDATMTKSLDPRASGANGNETFQSVYGHDQRSRSIASGVYNNMIDVAARFAIWGHAPQQAADAAHIMITAPDPVPGQPPFRVLPDKDAAGNLQVVMVRRPEQPGGEPQEFGGVIAMDPNTLRQIQNARRDAMPLIARREERRAKGEGEFGSIMRDLGLAINGTMRDAARNDHVPIVSPEMRQNRRQAIRAEADRVQRVGERERTRREGRGRVLDDADRAAMMGRANGVE
jgi:hypothetical protein